MTEFIPIYFILTIMTYFFLITFLKSPEDGFWKKTGHFILITILSAIWFISMPMLTGFVLKDLLEDEPEVEEEVLEEANAPVSFFSFAKCPACGHVEKEWVNKSKYDIASEVSDLFWETSEEYREDNTFDDWLLSKKENNR